MPSNNSSKNIASVFPPRVLVVIFAIVAFVGFIDATYLTVFHFLNTIPPCSIVQGCEQVTTSSYAAIGPVPVSLLGAAYYLLVFLFTLYALDSKKWGSFLAAIILTWFGAAVTAVLVVLQLFVIRAICLYCMFSALSTTILFVMGIFLLHYKKKGNSKPLAADHA